MASAEITPEIFAIIPTFDGETQTLDEFLDKFNGLLNLFNLNKVSGYKLLMMKVEGKAERAYQTAKKSGRVFDYQSLVDELGRILTTDGSKIKAKYGLTLEMKQDESLSEFADRIRKNVRKAYPNFAVTHQESLMADFYVRGLSPQLRSRMMSRTYATLNEALDRAEALIDRMQLSNSDGLEQKIEKLNKALEEVKLDQVNFMRHANDHSLHMRNEYEGDYPPRNEYDEDYFPHNEFERNEFSEREDSSREDCDEIFDRSFRENSDENFDDSFRENSDENFDRSFRENSDDNFDRSFRENSDENFDRSFREISDDNFNRSFRDYSDENFDHERDWTDDHRGFNDMSELESQFDYDYDRNTFQSSLSNHNNDQSFGGQREHFDEWSNRDCNSHAYYGGANPNERNEAEFSRMEYSRNRYPRRSGSFHGRYTLMLSLAVMCIASLPTALSIPSHTITNGNSAYFYVRSPQDRNFSQASETALTRTDNGTSSDILSLLGLFQEGMIALEEYKEKLPFWKKMGMMIHSMKGRAIAAAINGSQNITDFATEVEAKVIHFTSYWRNLVRQWIITLIMIVVLGTLLIFFVKYWLSSKFINCRYTSSSVILTTSGFSRNVNNASRRPTHEERYISANELMEPDEAIELIEDQARESRIRPKLELLPYSLVIICALSLLPVTTATNESEGTVITLTISTIVVMAFIMLLIALSIYSFVGARKSVEIYSTRQRVLVRKTDIKSSKSENANFKDQRVGYDRVPYDLCSQITPIDSKEAYNDENRLQKKEMFNWL